MKREGKVVRGGGADHIYIYIYIFMLPHLKYSGFWAELRFLARLGVTNALRPGFELDTQLHANSNQAEVKINVD